MDTKKISDDDLLLVIRYFLDQFKAGESRRFDLAQAGAIVEKLTSGKGRLPAH